MLGIEERHAQTPRPILKLESILSMSNKLKIYKSIVEPKAFYVQKFVITRLEDANKMSLLSICLGLLWYVNTKSTRKNAKVKDISNLQKDVAGNRFAAARKPRDPMHGKVGYIDHHLSRPPPP